MGQYSHALLWPSLGASMDTLDFVKGCERQTVRPTPAVVLSSNTRTLLLGALEGMGIAMVPAAAVEDALRDGQLVHVLPKWRIEGMDATVSLIYPARRHLSAKTRLFVDAVLDYFRERVTGVLPLSFQQAA